MFAWILLAPLGRGDSVERAISAGRLLRSLGSRGQIICFVASCSSTTGPPPESLTIPTDSEPAKHSLQTMTQLALICDHVVVRRPCPPVSNNREENDGNLPSSSSSTAISLDQFLVDVINSERLLCLFETIAFLHPDVVIVNPPDSTFEATGLIRDTRGDWAGIVVNPRTTTICQTGQQPSMMINSINSLNELCSLIGPHPQMMTASSIPTLSDLSGLLALEKELTFVKLSNNNGISRDLKSEGGIWNEFLFQKIKPFLEPAFPSSTHSRSPSSMSALLASGIAVIGMSCRFPQSNSPEEYWRILESGGNTAGGPPSERTLLVPTLDPSAQANWLACRVDHFDAEFFGLAPSEAEFTDPQSRLLLETSWKALEDAGLNPDRLTGSPTGVFYGSWTQDYKELMNLDSSVPTSHYLRKYMGNGFGGAAAKLSFFYGFTGPNIATESACSSSMVGVELALGSLLRGECSLALAAGANLILQWAENKAAAASVWAPDGKSKTFDANVDGYGRGEGVGVLVLKRYSDALASNDRIYGVIVGSGVSQEGESVSFGAPTAKSEGRAMRAALRSASMSPADVDFIEAHATGTAVGDPVEAVAIAESYGVNPSSSFSSQRRSSPLYVASGKTNIGHTESCSGIAGIIKVLLSLQHETIPPHLNVVQLNPKLNSSFEQIPAFIPFQSVPWPRNPARPRVAGVSSFGITGTDVHMIIREAPEERRRPGLSCVRMTLPQPLCLSAKSRPALEALTEAYLSLLDDESKKGTNNPDPDRTLMDMVYTANATRARHQHRRVLLGSTVAELAGRIRQRCWIDGQDTNNNKRLGGGNKSSLSSSSPRAAVCFAFPGLIGKMELSQAKGLYSNFPVFRMSMDHCEHVFRDVVAGGGPTRFLSIWNDAISIPSPRPMEWYALVVSIQYSLALLWRSWGLVPNLVLGHCLGEIAASLVSGGLGLDDAFRMISLVKRLYELEAHSAGVLLAVMGDGERVKGLIREYLEEVNGGGAEKVEKDEDGWLEVAALHSKAQTVVAGPPSTIQKFRDFCAAKRDVVVDCQLVPADFPIHSRGIQNALNEVRGDLPRRRNLNVGGSPPPIRRLTHISSVTGGILGTGADGQEVEEEDYWYNCFRNEIRFTAACQTAASVSASTGADLIVLEIGLGSSLSKLILENAEGSGSGGGWSPVCIPSFRQGGDDGGGIVESLASLVALGVSIDWEGYYQFYPVSKVPLPHYPFQRKSFWFKTREKEEEEKGEEKEGRMTTRVCQTRLKKIHPLLGSRLSVADTQNVIFEGSLLNSRPSSSYSSLSYIEHHRIGTEVVFPAAGYLEMMLAAGRLLLQQQQQRREDHHADDDSLVPEEEQIITIQDFLISAPLLVDKCAGGARLQCVLYRQQQNSAEESNKIAVFSGGADVDAAAQGWRLHASGICSKSSSEKEQESLRARIDVKGVMERCPLVPGGPSQFYQALGSTGLNFGESFRSIVALRRGVTVTNDEETLAEVQCKTAQWDDDDEGYVLHPILIDSMIQALFSHVGVHSSGKLKVPVSLRKLLLVPSRITTPGGGGGSNHGGNNPHSFFYVYCKQASAGARGTTTTATLLDSRGRILAIMEEAPVLATTSVEGVLEAGRGSRSLGNTTPSSLDTYEVGWEPARHQIPHAIREPPPPLASEVEEEESSSFAGSAPDSFTRGTAGMMMMTSSEEEEQRLDDDVNRLCFLYVLNMLYELGWRPEEPSKKTFRLAHLISEFRVKDSLALAFSRYMDYLVEEGFLERTEGKEEEEDDDDGGGELCTLVAPIPSWSSVQADILALVDRLQDSYPATQVIAATGSKLAPILRGEFSGQYILFGGGGAEGSSTTPLKGDTTTLAEIYYSTTRFAGEQLAAMRQVFEVVCKEHLQSFRGSTADQPAEPIRILEVGAGTGSLTRAVMMESGPVFASASTPVARLPPFQYFFTDISSTHFERAKERFGGLLEQQESFVYKTLDIERDPLEQGFAPAYFDIIAGLDVFHATSHLQNAVGKVAMLLRPGGTLLIGETEGPVREIDLVFGILSGYWQLQDTDLRSNRHCLVRAEVWEGILREGGLTQVSHVLTGGGKKSVIWGRLDNVTAAPAVSESGVGSINKKTWLVIGDNFPEEFDRFIAGLRRYGRESVVLGDPRIRENDLVELINNSLVEGILCFAGARRRSNTSDWKDRRELLQGLFTISRFLAKRRSLMNPLPRLHLVTTGTWASGHEGDWTVLVDPSPAALWGLARNARVEIPGLNSKSIDLDPQQFHSEDWIEALLKELWLEDGEPDILHRQGVRYVRRLLRKAEQHHHDHPRSRKPPKVVLEYPIGNRFRVSLPSSKELSGLTFVSVPEGPAAEDLTGEELEVEVRAASLNFRDVFIVLKPGGSIFESISTLGLDYSGVVSRVGTGVKSFRVGDRVYGISLQQSTIASHIIVAEEQCTAVRLPPPLTFAEAATLPAVFLTAWYSMVSVAGLRAGMTVLVHAVTGGVGLAAVQIAKLLGVEVIGTAGSARKRNFARSSLGLKHVFNSRDCGFGDKVRAATTRAAAGGGAGGVDMVLNCLTGPGFKETSMDLVKDGGSFVELSKLDIWTEEEVAVRRPGVHYKVVWMPDIGPELLRTMLDKMNELVGSGELRPLAHTRFQASHLPSALGLLQRAGHIGKVIVELPVFQAERVRFTEQPLFGGGGDRTYLITGGMGAIGLAVAKWMVAAQGARHIVLVGRSKPSVVALETIGELEERFGATVIWRQLDISSYEEVRELFEDLFSGGRIRARGGGGTPPPLGGIHHCAGILSDKLLVNMGWEEFQSVLSSKVDGLYNLHHLSSHLPLPLEHFVAYSSLVSVFGNVGQSNYAAGNAYMDCLMEARVAAGLKGLVVNWGQWNAGLAEHVQMKILSPFSTQEGILALERFMRENKTSVLAGKLELGAILKMYPNYRQTFLARSTTTAVFGETNKKLQTNVGGGGTEGQSHPVPFLAQYNSFKDSMDEGERGGLIVNFVRETVSSILGLREEDEVEEDGEGKMGLDTDFSSMGMDSLMSIEFTNKLQSQLGPGVTLGYVNMEEYGSVRKMSAFLESLINNIT